SSCELHFPKKKDLDLERSGLVLAETFPRGADAGRRRAAGRRSRSWCARSRECAARRARPSRSRSPRLAAASPRCFQQKDSSAWKSPEDLSLKIQGEASTT